MNKISSIIAGAFLGAVTCSYAQSSRPVDNHKVEVKEVVQTTNYTYLKVNEHGITRWLAVPSMQAKAGEVYYYTGPMPMVNFESKELKKTFDTVLFLGAVSSEPFDAIKKPAADTAAKPYKRTAPTLVKKDIKIDHAKGGITISELLGNKDKYAGRTVIIKGQVTKYNPQIMEKNWIHLQDGTENDGKFDLMITSQDQVKVGDIVTLEGKISLNKDFGYGYAFDVMMEDAKKK